VRVEPGQEQAFTWPGKQYSFELYQGCSCHRDHVAPAGRYRVTVPVWDKAFDPEQGELPPPTRYVEVGFELPGTGQVLVPLGP
jgi:hypothetical protein